MNKLEKLQSRLLAEKLSVQARRDNGRLGEIVVESWLREVPQLEVEPLPQDKGTKKFLLPDGGKRPDFAVEMDGDVFFVDAKLHQTQGLSEFSLDITEIAEFRKAMHQLDIGTLFIALLPREAVDCLFLIELSDIENKNEHGAPGVFRLDVSDNLRRFGPVSKEAFDRAILQYRREGFSGDVPEYPAFPTSMQRIPSTL